MREIFRLVGGEDDGREGKTSDLGDNQPNVIETSYGGETYTYASAIEEGSGAERQRVRLYRLAHVVNLEEI